MVRTRTRTRGAKKGTGRGVNNNFCLTPREGKRLQEHPAFHEQSGDTRRPTRPPAAPRSRSRPRPRAPPITATSTRRIRRHHGPATAHAHANPCGERPHRGNREQFTNPRSSTHRLPRHQIHTYPHHAIARRGAQVHQLGVLTAGVLHVPPVNALELRAQGPYVAGPSQGSSVQPQGGTPACRSTPPPSPCSPSR